MNKRFLTLSLSLLCGLGCAFAQVELINPVPHNAVKGELVSAPKSWKIVCDEARAASYAVTALQNATPEQSSAGEYTLTIGAVGDKCVKSYRKLAPKTAEGYYLKVDTEKKSIVIAGADERGVFYGVQSLLAIMSEGKLQACTITDYPDVRFRGVVEGFYGQPFSHQNRLDQFEFYGKNKMNVYIYGPKDDPYHRDRWRVPYPEEEAQRIKQLAEYAKKFGVNFYWAIHPGVDIKWTDEDRDALVKKLEIMYDLGVRSFAVFFDDIWGEGTKADKQAALLNYVDDNFVQKKHDVSPLVMCPTEYNRAWANDEKGYLQTLGSQMNKTVEIMWTGNSVVACIDKPSMEWVNSRIQRKGYIWWNYPVSDFVRDRMLLGPVYGNGLDIANDVSGFLSNPMQFAETSKVALYSIADYTWNMAAYDANASWEKAIKDLLPENHEALREFALYNKDLGPNCHGFRRDEGEELKSFADRIQSGNFTTEDVGVFFNKCMSLGTAADVLLGDKSNPGLIQELRPWLLQAKNLADYGMAVCLLQLSGDKQFVPFYKQARSIQEQMYNLENDPNVLNPYQTGAKLGTKVLLPTLNKIFAVTVEKYNERNNANYDPVSEYNPFKMESDVQQLALLPISVKGSDVTVTPSHEVINWQAGGSFTITGDRDITFQGMDFNFGIPDVAKHFKLELLSGGQWKEVSLLHYSDTDPVIHTGNELGGMQAKALRITNKSGAEQKVYFKHFKFVKR